MIRSTAKSLLLALCVSLPVVPAIAQDDNQPPEGFTALIGEDLSNWIGGNTRDPRKITERQQTQWNNKILEHWSLDGIELVSDGHGPHLATPQEHGDFEFWVDWKIQTGGDSGIYLRGVPQVQIWDPNHEPAHRHGSDRGSGGLWNNRGEKWPSEVADNPIGEWNRMYVRMVGQYVTVVLNDVTVVENVTLQNFYERAIPVFMRGTIHLQTHGNESRFRNVFVREIPHDEANAMLAEMNDGEEGFVPLFNGEDLTGWTGATDNYEVIDGAIQCKQGRGGNLITEDTYDNFTVRLEFKLPPGGNNGLAIRTPNAEADPAHDALELQVLDSTAEKYADLEAYQFHGSAYGIAPAHQGHLRPVGEWNYQEVVVNGDHVQVFLNGFKVLDTHLAQANPDHPAASITEGYFGFCGHNDPVAFRNIRIRPIE